MTSCNGFILDVLFGDAEFRLEEYFHGAENAEPIREALSRDIAAYIKAFGLPPFAERPLKEAYYGTCPVMFLYGEEGWAVERIEVSRNVLNVWVVPCSA